MRSIETRSLGMDGADRWSMEHSTQEYNVGGRAQTMTFCPLKVVGSKPGNRRPESVGLGEKGLGPPTRGPEPLLAIGAPHGALGFDSRASHG